MGANLLKVTRGGWLPLGVAALVFTLMTTWKTGRRLVAERLTARAIPVEDFMASVAATKPTRVTGTAVFMTAQPQGTPPALVHNLRYNKILHEHVVILTVTTTHSPYVSLEDQVTVEKLGQGIYNVKVQYGFMQDPDVPGGAGARRGSWGWSSTRATSRISSAARPSSSPNAGAWRCGARSCSC